MKMRLLLALVGLAIGLALPTFAQQTNTSTATSTATPSTAATPSTQTKKERNFSGTHYWSSTPKGFQVDPDRAVVQLELFGVRVDDSGDGPFHGASVHIAAVGYSSKGYNKFTSYETWTDEDGDKVIWELMSTPPGGSGKLIDGTGKYTGWQGTMEFALQYSKSFPEGTIRGICREVVKIVAPQQVLTKGTLPRTLATRLLPATMEKSGSRLESALLCRPLLKRQRRLIRRSWQRFKPTTRHMMMPSIYSINIPTYSWAQTTQTT